MQRLEESGGHIQAQKKVGCDHIVMLVMGMGLEFLDTSSKHGHSEICMMERKGMTNALNFLLFWVSLACSKDVCYQCFILFFHFTWLAYQYLMIDVPFLVMILIITVMFIISTMY